jgi:transposase-like protein
MFSNVKTREREEARMLRRDEGLPIKEIARRVGVSVSSVSVWVRDVELTAEQRRELLMLNPAYNRQLNGAAMNASRNRARRLAYQEEGRRLARLGEPLYLAGCMLYWAEGAKTRNQLRFSNSDPEMARFFVDFLKEYFDLDDAEIRLTCNLFADHVERQREIEQFWLDCLGLPHSSLCTSTVNTYSKYSQKKRQNKLPYGTCRIGVSRTRVIQSIYGSIQEIGGFERDSWLE